MQDIKYIISKESFLRKPLENVLHKNKGIHFFKKGEEKEIQWKQKYKRDLQDHICTVHLKINQPDWNT